MVGKQLRCAPLFLSLFPVLLFLSHCATQDSGLPKVVLETTQGRIVLELDPQSAPITVDNFLQYVDSAHFDGTIFHRVIDGFMIQGGGFTENLQEKTTRPPIENEADNGLKNARGTIAMARTNDPHSATAQFFINSVDNLRLNHQSKTPTGWGYTAFGQVIEGMEVVDSISKVRTGQRGRMADVPIETIVIERAYRQ